MYIHESLVNIEKLKRFYLQAYYDENTCQRCDNFKKRHNHICNSCPAFLGRIKLWNETKTANGTWYGLPNGHLPRLSHLLKVDLFYAIDQRAVVRMPYPLTFTGKLYDGTPYPDGTPRVNQVELVKTWLQHKFGIIRAPPRSGGKTVIACWLACNSGLRTIILVHQDMIAQQFMTSFNQFTNLRQLVNRVHRPLVGIVYRMEDFNKYDNICIVNYQKFIGDLSDRIVQHITGKFGLCCVDECHNIGALAYSKVISRVDCRYKFGLTATPWRRDHRHLIARDIIGPVTAESQTTALLPEIFLHWTDIELSPYKRFITYRKWLHNHEERRNIVVRQVFNDLRAGHRVIIIPVDVLAYQADLIEAINKQAVINRNKRFEPWPQDLAVALNEKSNQQEVLKLVDSGRMLVLVAIRKMIREGINMLWPSVLYSVEPTSAVRVNDIGAPLFQQMAHRICTYFPKKKLPIIRIFIDAGISHACAKNLLRYEILPRIKPRKIKSGALEQPRYRINAQQLLLAKDILSKPVEGTVKGGPRRFQRY